MKVTSALYTLGGSVLIAGVDWVGHDILRHCMTGRQAFYVSTVICSTTSIGLSARFSSLSFLRGSALLYTAFAVSFYCLSRILVSILHPFLQHKKRELYDALLIYLLIQSDQNPNTITEDGLNGIIEANSEAYQSKLRNINIQKKINFLIYISCVEFLFNLQVSSHKFFDSHMKSEDADFPRAIQPLFQNDSFLYIYRFFRGQLRLIEFTQTDPSTFRDRFRVYTPKTLVAFNINTSREMYNCVVRVLKAIIDPQPMNPWLVVDEKPLPGEWDKTNPFKIFPERPLYTRMGGYPSSSLIQGDI